MKNNIIKPSILAGFMELLPKEQKKFDDIVKKITAVYEENGCEAIDTPIIEKSEVLLAKSGGETEKQVYSFEKGKNKMALRFDLTVPFARYTAQHFDDLAFPFRRYQLGKVYRGERNQRGRYREFYQCDVDVIGKNSLSINNDAWVISLADKAFKAIGLSDYKFEISNRKILKGILSEFEIKRENDVMTLIDKYDKIGGECFNEELVKIIDPEQAKVLNDIISIQGSSAETIKKLSSFKFSSETFIEGIKELEKVTDMLSCLGVSSDKFEINLKIIRGLDYYTGTVFETFLTGNESYGSVCSGGRYDNLAEKYTNNVLPGVGMSIGITRLFFVLTEIGFIDTYKADNTLDYLILPLGNTMEYCIEVMNALQKKNYSVAVYFEESTLKKMMIYANKAQVENVIIIGEDEVKNKSVKSKNMRTGKEESIKL